MPRRRRKNKQQPEQQIDQTILCETIAQLIGVFVNHAPLNNEDIEILTTLTYRCSSQLNAAVNEDTKAQLNRLPLMDPNFGFFARHLPSEEPLRVMVNGSKEIAASFFKALFPDVWIPMDGECILKIPYADQQGTSVVELSVIDNYTLADEKFAAMRAAEVRQSDINLWIVDPINRIDALDEYVNIAEKHKVNLIFIQTNISDHTQQNITDACELAQNKFQDFKNTFIETFSVEEIKESEMMAIEMPLKNAVRAWAIENPPKEEFEEETNASHHRCAVM